MEQEQVMLYPQHITEAQVLYYMLNGFNKLYTQ
jgi:hypothetical protein